MSLEKKPDYIKLKSHYRGYILEEFNEDYYNYRAVIRLINSYFKNPHNKKTHDIYNRLIILHRVFNKNFINKELIVACDDELKKSYLKYILNEFFSSKFNIEYFEEHWETDIEYLKKCNITCRI